MRQSQIPSPLKGWGLYALGGIVLAAIVIRLCGTNYGLPFIYHTDEIFEVKRALKLGAFHFDLERAFKGGLYYILFVEYVVYYAVLYLAGSIRSASDYLTQFFRDPTGFWMIGRVTVAVIGALNVFLVYRLGAKVRNQTTGILAALFLAFAFDHTWSSRFITVDVLMVTLLTATLIQIVGMIQTGERRHYLLAALFAALAVMTKLPAIIVLVSFAIARGYRVWTERKPFYHLVIDSRVLLALVVFLGVTAIGNPGFFQEMVNQFANFAGKGPPMINPYDLDPFPDRTDNTWIYYLGTMAFSLGIPLLILSLAGIFRVLVRRSAIEVTLLAFAVLSYLFICLPWREDLIYPRYSLPVQIILVVLAADLLDSARRKFGGKPWIWVAVACLLVAWPFYQSLRHGVLQSRSDTRTLAREWIVENVPEGTSIVLEGRGYGSSPNTVALDNLPANVEVTVERYRNSDERWSRDPDYGMQKDRFHQAVIRALDEKKTYNLISTEKVGASYLRLYEYIEQGAEYLVVDPIKLAKFLDGVNYERFPQVGDFYRDILESPRLERIKRFEPVGRLGPTLEIYRVK